MSGSEPRSVETTIDNGVHGTRVIRFETGHLARQAAGSAVAYLDEETMLLSATTASKHPKEHFDFFPLTVDVEERMYAAGRIPGSFFRREGRPSEDAILTCRLIDRPLRPSFVSGLRNEVQVVITVMAVLKSYDERLDQAAATLGASTWKTLRYVTLPLIAPGIVSAFLFAFIVSFDELTIALFTTGGLSATLPKLMWDDAVLKVSPLLAAVSTVLLVFISIMILAAEWFRRQSAKVAQDA